MAAHTRYDRAASLPTAIPVQVWTARRSARHHLPYGQWLYDPTRNAIKIPTRVKQLAIDTPLPVVRGNQPLARLLAGQTCSSLADWLLAVILTVVVYDVSRSGTTVALLMFTRMAPYGLVLPWSGVVLDRFDRRRITAGLGFGRALCMVGLLVVHSRASLPLAFPLAFVSSALSCVLRPTINATIPSLVSPQDTGRANSLVSLVDGAAHILGPALGGAFLLVHQTRPALLVAASTFVFSGIFFLSARLPRWHATGDSTSIFDPAHVLAGFRYLLRENERTLVALTATAAGLALLAGGYYSLAVVLSTQSFHFGGQGVGWLDMVFGIGNLIGSLALGVLLRGRRVAHLFIAGAATNSLGVVLLALSPPGPAPFVCLSVVGFATVVVTVTATTILQAAAPRDMLGRVFTAFEAALVVATLAGALIVGPLMQLTGPRAAAFSFGCGGLILLLLSLPILRSLEDVLGLRVFLRGVPLLAGLPRPLLDELAPHFYTGAADAGEAIVREGEVGDALYIIRRGHVEVSIAGRVVRTLGPAGYFGELALIHGIPRTATVQARTRAEFYCLDRATFLALVRQVDGLAERLQHEANTRYVYSSPGLLSGD